MLTLTRFAAAVALPGALGRAARRPEGDLFPLLLWIAAAATDYADGPLARRRGPTWHGALLDGVADVTFVLAGTGTAARLGLVSPIVPLAIALAFAAYVVASLRRRGGGATRSVARTRLGHAAGVCNYLLTGMVAASVAWPWSGWRPLLGASGMVVAALDLGAVALRLRRARATRDGGRRARSARSSA